MNILPIVHYPDPRLRLVAEEVTVFDEAFQEEATSLALTCQVYQAQGLAATQVGINKRVFVSITEGSPEIYVNPKIVSTEGTQKMSEGCLSFPGAYALVERPEELVLEFQTIEGESRTVAMDGLEAVAAAHEIDHLNGVLFIDKVGKLMRGIMLKKLAKATKVPNKKKSVPSKRAAARVERKRQKAHKTR